MELDYLKELTPVIYGEKAVRLLAMDVPPDCLCFQPHWHERIELILVKKGQLHLTLDGADYVLEANDTAVIMPRKLHSGISGNAGVRYSVVMFDLSSFMNKTPIASRYLSASLAGDFAFEGTVCPSAIKRAVENIETHYASDRPADALHIISDVYALLADLYGTVPENPSPRPSCDPAFAAVLNYVGDHFCDKITPAGLSRRFGYDEAYFCRKFKAVTGLTPLRYITILRLEKAQELLSDENTVAQTAHLCGFGDANYFTRCFKAQYGITPTQFERAAAK